tara:strand:+ start:100 stop:630 length:531 start_codon:yes stop_codon:yes gene_type:complete
MNRLPALLAAPLVFGLVALAGCEEKSAPSEAAQAKSVATDAPATALPSVAESAAPSAAEPLSPEETYAAFLAGVTAKGPLSEVTKFMTRAEGVKIRNQIEGAKDPERMLALFYRMHDPVAEGHDPTVVSSSVEGVVATLIYKVKAPKTGDLFEKVVTFELHAGEWRIQSIEIKSAK